MQLENQGDKGSSSYQGVSLSYDEEEFIEGFMAINSDMASSKKRGNFKHLNSTNSMENGNR